MAALTDGAARYTERFGLGSWSDALRLLAESGPAELIAQVQGGRAGRRRLHALAAGQGARRRLRRVRPALTRPGRAGPGVARAAGQSIGCPNEPAWKSSKACWSSSWVFITNGP